MEEQLKPGDRVTSDSAILIGRVGVIEAEVSSGRYRGGHYRVRIEEEHMRPFDYGNPIVFMFGFELKRADD